MPAFTEFLFLDRPTAATYLAGVLGVYKQHVPTSILSFVGTELLEHAPSSIDHTFVQSAFGSGPHWAGTSRFHPVWAWDVYSYWQTLTPQRRAFHRHSPVCGSLR